MKKFAIAIAFLSMSCLAQAEVVGKVTTSTKLIGSNDSIVVESLNDPDIQGITCHISYAKAGGISGDMGFGEDPSRFSIACRQTGPIVTKTSIKEQKVISAFDRNIFFKAMKVERMFDQKNNTVVYLIYSRKLLDGSPFNSISSIPLMPWGSTEPQLQVK